MSGGKRAGVARYGLRPGGTLGATGTWILALVGVAFFAARPAAAQSYDACEEPAELARELEATWPWVEKYAPEYLFAPGELYFPTMPFFTAFDGKDNDGDGPLDFEDPTEIAALRDGHPSWSWLDSVYRADPVERKAERSAIHYRVRELTKRQVDDLWRFLISDEQAWKRLDIRPTLFDSLRREEVSFLAVEFYAYYLNDLGLIGHHQDIEYVRMFVPVDAAAPDPFHFADQFRVYVGAGHTERVPNNVLVISGRLAARSRDVPPGVLVELGDHSSAPDLRPRGEFAPGYDANWHAYDLWGTRDTQASSGMGALGRYETWMTFPRGGELQTIVIHHHTRHGVDPMQEERYAEKATDSGEYVLVPARVFECLSEELDADGEPERIAAWLGLLGERIEATHDLHALGAWRFRTGFEELDPGQQAAAIEAMRRWNEGHYVARGDGAGPVGANKTLVWRSKHYRNPPTDAFKQHLFRPVFGALQRLGHWADLFHIWLTWQPDRAMLLTAGFDVPAFHLPFRLPGYLEAHAGIYSSCRNVVESCGARGESPALGLLHTWHYNRTITWYNRVTWVPQRERADGDPNAEDWLVGGGLSLTPWIFRLRIGLSADLDWESGPKLGEPVWELILSRL